VLLLCIEMESILRGSFVSLASKGYPNHCHTPIGIAENANTDTSAWPGFPEAIDSSAVRLLKTVNPA
jgi:hypothetical protein